MKMMIFLADAFVEDYVGGAELTSHAIMQGIPEGFQIAKIRCSELNKDVINRYQSAHWVILNFSSLSQDLKLHLVKNVEYSIVEYDYKFCDFRSIDLCRLKTSKECECVGKKDNKINLAFYGYAKKIWFMSDSQKQIFLEKVKTIKQENTQTLNSVFSVGDLRFIDSLKDNEKGENYIIVKTSSWIKDFQKCINYAQDNKLKYEVVSNLPYHELLIKLSTSRGLIFLPAGADTCPRLVMEAQMLGCETILNDNVQHKEESWASDATSCREHMNTRCSTFWSFYEQG
jgi:hypothetical protein|tara:strand:- start:259 stop:1116 length:858 start_codon:yes stop_codon:yes gene_type:complete